MSLSVERGLMVQAVMEGQIGAEHVTVDELISAHHLLADAAIHRAAWNIIQAEPLDQVRVFDLAWQWDQPN
jgi:hypothetical protein